MEEEEDCVEKKLLVWARQNRWNDILQFFKQVPRLKYNVIDKYQMPWGDNVVMMAIEKCSDIKILNDLVDRYKNIFFSNKKGETQLHVAVKRRDLQIVELVLSKMGATTLGIKNNLGETPIFTSGYLSSKESFLYLFTKFLAYHQALRNNHRDYYEDLNYYEHYLVRNDGNSILHLSIRHGFTDIALRVIKTFPGLMKKKNNEGFTPFHELALHPASFKSGYGRCIWGSCCKCWGMSETMLHEKNKVSLELANELITTMHVEDFAILAPVLDVAVMQNGVQSGPRLSEPVMVMPVIVYAVKNGITELVKLILDSYPTEIGTRDEKHFNLFFLAVEARQPCVFQFLLETSFFEHLITEVIDGQTILHIAAKISSQAWREEKYAFCLESLWYQRVKRNLKEFLLEDTLVKMESIVNNEKKNALQVFDESHDTLTEKGFKFFQEISKAYAIFPSTALGFAIAASSFVMSVTKGETTSSGRVHAFVFFVFMTLVSASFSLIEFSSVTSAHPHRKSNNCAPKSIKSYVYKQKKSPWQLFGGLISGILSLIFLIILFFLGESLGNGEKLLFLFGWTAILPLIALFYLIWPILRDLHHICLGNVEYFVNRRRPLQQVPCAPSQRPSEAVLYAPIEGSAVPSPPRERSVPSTPSERYEGRWPSTPSESS